MKKLLFFIFTLISVKNYSQDYSLIHNARKKIEQGKYEKVERLLSRAEKADYGFCGTARMEADIEIQQLRFVLYKETDNTSKMKHLLDSIEPIFESSKYSLERINILLKTNPLDSLKIKIENAIKNYDCKKINYGNTYDLEISEDEYLKLYIDSNKVFKLMNDGYNCSEALRKYYFESEYYKLLPIN